MPTSYADAFRDHARQNLDRQVYDALHRKARGTAGGTALRNPAVREIRFDGAKYSREQVVDWLRRNNYNEAGLQPDGENWLFQSHGGLPMQDETTRSLGAGITAVVGRYQPEAEGQKGGLLNAVTKIFKSLIIAAAADADERAPAATAPVDAYVAKAHIDAAYFDAAALLAGQDYYAGLGHEPDDARSLGLAMIEKDAEAFEDERQQWTMGPPDLDGLDVHLGSGSGRLRGHFGFDLVRKEADHGTVIHDLNLGIPLPDASARSVVVTKTMGELTETPAALAWEIRRVLMPGGRLYTAHGGPIMKDSAGGLVHLRRTDLMHEYLRVTDPAEYGDIRKVLEATPGFVVHEGGDTDPSSSSFQTISEPKREAIRKALAPDRTIPMVTASPHRQIVYCTVLEPDSFDAHGDTMTPADIEFTAHRYLTKSRVIGSGHTKAIQARPVESFIAPQDLFYETGPFGPQRVLKGSWVVGIHVEDPGEWQKVLEGEYTGVSIGGFGMREAV
jgi:hypothetical protein